MISSMVATTIAPASSTCVRTVAKSPTNAPVCDCAALRALALRPASISTTGLPAARARRSAARNACGRLISSQ